MKVCALKDCGIPIRNPMLMCKKHWSMVPMRVQKEVWDKARAYQKSNPRGDAEAFRLAHTEYYAVVRVACKEVWNKLQA